jgi:hypothetical protein
MESGSTQPGPFFLAFWSQSCNLKSKPLRQPLTKPFRRSKPTSATNSQSPPCRIPACGPRRSRPAYDIALLARAEDKGCRPPVIAFDQNDAAADVLRHAAEFMEDDTDEG